MEEWNVFISVDYYLNLSMRVTEEPSMHLQWAWIGYLVWKLHIGGLDNSQVIFYLVVVVRKLSVNSVIE
jgi:hypothetical protein